MQRFLGGGDGVEQREAGLARHDLVVPLEQELHRDGDAGRGVGEGVVADETEDSGGDPGFGGDERHTDHAAQRHPPVPHGSARPDAVEVLESVQGGLPLGNGLGGTGGVVLGDQRADGLAGRHPLPQFRGEPLVVRGSWPVAVPGCVDRDHRETEMCRVAVGTGHQTRGGFVLTASVSEQHQGAGPDGINRGPEHTGDAVKGEQSFRDAGRGRL